MFSFKNFLKKAIESVSLLVTSKIENNVVKGMFETSSTYTVTPTLSSNWTTSADITAFRIGANLVRIYFYGSRSANVTAGDSTNEDIVTLKIDTFGEVKSAYSTVGNTWSSGDLATFKATVDGVDENGIITVRLRITASRTATKTWNVGFLIPICLNVNNFVEEYSVTYLTDEEGNLLINELEELLITGE